MRPSSELPLWAWRHIPNFGDALSADLVRLVFGRSVTFPHPTQTRMVAVGSVLQQFFYAQPIGSWLNGPCWLALRRKFKPKIEVWGTGFLLPRILLNPLRQGEKIFPKRRLQLLAVRGKKTLALCRTLGFSCDGVALGDPGLLYGRLLGDVRPAPCYDVGLMLHKDDDPALGDALVVRIVAAGYRVCRLQVCGDPMTTLRDLAACRTVLSSAMHGLIVADGLGIPNRWLRLSRLHPSYSEEDYRFKFEDYYSVYAAPMPEPWRQEDIPFADLPSRIEKEYDIDPEDVAAVVRGLLTAAGRSAWMSPRGMEAGSGALL